MSTSGVKDAAGVIPVRQGRSDNRSICLGLALLADTLFEIEKATWYRDTRACML